MYKIHLYDVQTRTQLDDVTIKKYHELYDIKHINYNFEPHQVILVTIVRMEHEYEYNHDHDHDDICRTFLVYNPYKNLWRAIYRRFESMASCKFMDLLFE